MRQGTPLQRLRVGRAVRRHAHHQPRKKIRASKPSEVSRRLNFAESVTPTTTKSKNATINAYHAQIKRTRDGMSVDCIRNHATTPEAVMNVQTTVLVFMPSNVRAHARAREIVDRSAPLLARRGGARC